MNVLSSISRFVKHFLSLFITVQVPWLLSNGDNVVQMQSLRELSVKRCISDSFFSTECVSVGINYLFHMLFNLIDMLINVYNKRKTRDKKPVEHK